MAIASINTSNKLLTPASGTTIYVDYLPHKKILEVAYSGGHIYQYQNVGISIWEEYKKIIASGGSSGKFVNSKIKPSYKFKQIK